MASPITGGDIPILAETADLCARLKALIGVPAQLKSFLDWLLTSTGEVSDSAVDSLQDRVFPIGAVVPYAGGGAPNSRWLMANGEAVSRTTYATLFSRIGTAFGVGDGTTTFNLPNLQGRVPVGNGGSIGSDLASTAGAASVNVDLTHYHGVGKTTGNDNLTLLVRDWSRDPNGTTSGVGISGDDVDDADTPYETSGNASTTDEIVGTSDDLSAVTIATVQPSLILNYLIKAL